MKYSLGQYPYASRRVTLQAANGMVSTLQPLAAQAGLEILKKGGNAIDAAIATAVCLTVVDPTNNGIGGDTFALVWAGGKIHGLNASGPAPMSISIDSLTQKGHKEMPVFGLTPVTVPGAPSAWAELSEKFGKLPLTEVMQPAIEYAERGFPVSPSSGAAWQGAFNMYRSAKEEAVKHWFETFAQKGRAPEIGEIWRSPDHAKTLRAIAESKAEVFYKGDLADQIDRFSRLHGGYIRKKDLERYKPEWVDPIKVNYRGYDVWEIPPNGHGMVALMALNILKGFEFDEPYTEETLHKQFEAMKLAYVDGKKYITDINKMKVSVEDLLSEAYAEERRKMIGDQAHLPLAGRPSKGGTVYMATADDEGNMVSLIQSNYMWFGSGVVIPGTGISLQNRGNNFSLDPEHDNCLEPGKKTYHTIIPAFLTKNDQAVGPFGVVGAFMQPQGHVQIVMNTIDFHMNPQAALDAPRWRWIEDKIFHMEGRISEQVLRTLVDKGHHLISGLPLGKGFGSGNIIWRESNGIYTGASESRSDGTVLGW
jgi:gamma-glutamyltranspeptidase/glutathione hydrolase